MIGKSPVSSELRQSKNLDQSYTVIRVRATVFHDSYERLIEVPCFPSEHIYQDGRPALKTLAPTIADVVETGINLEKVSEAVSLDEGIAEFSRFYLERREQEVRFAGNDERKARKLYDEFTPRFAATVVALEGKVYREIYARAHFDIDEGVDYESIVAAVPSSGEIKSFLGFKTNYVGFVFSPQRREVIGKVTQGKRTRQGWFEI